MATDVREKAFKNFPRFIVNIARDTLHAAAARKSSGVSVSTLQFSERRLEVGSQSPLRITVKLTGWQVWLCNVSNASMHKQVRLYLLTPNMLSVRTFLW
jgi:hypothetical protein